MRGDLRGLARSVRTMAAILAAIGGQCAPAHAGAPEAVLTVRASVPRHASIRMAQPRTLTISQADVARGYVEVAAPLAVHVQSNVQQGYTLAFECQGGDVRQAHVHGLQSELTVGSAGALSARPAAGPGTWREQLSLRFRFDLAPGVQPGEHAWPLNISMLPP